MYSIAGALFSDLKTNNYLEVFNTEYTDESDRFKARNLFFEPGFSINCPVAFIDIELNAGYQIQLGSRSFFFEENRNISLVNPETQEPVLPGWNGFRVGVSVFYIFNSAANRK